jgi:hypothetical protein
MRWFKHISNAHQDEKMARLVSELGLEGYGFYWLILETVAGQIEAGSDRTDLDYPIAFWRKITGFSPKKLRKFAEFCSEIEIFSAKFSENSLTIDIPNILKYRDEWSKKKGRNSGVTTEQLRSKDTDTDTEIEEERVSACACACVADSVPEYSESPDPFPADSRPKKTDCPSKGHPQWPAFCSCYDIFPVQQGKEDAWREWMRLFENGTLEQSFVIRDAILLLSAEDDRWLEGYAPRMAKWLNGKGWDDQPYKKPVAVQSASRASPQRPRLSAKDERLGDMARQLRELEQQEADHGNA